MTDGMIAVHVPLEPKAGGAAGSFLMANSRFVVPAIIAAMTFVAYLGTLRYEFVYDDVYVIVQNSSIQSWAAAPRYFTEHLWFFKLPMTNYYRPIFLVWIALNHTLFGLNPVGYHLTTVLAHVGVTVLVFHLARRLTGDRATAAIASILFGLHPAHIESAAWVCGVSEPLLGLFLIGSFLCYLKYRDAGSGSNTRWLIVSLVLALLAVFEKETGVIFPLLIFAYEVIFRRSREAPALEERGLEPKGSWLSAMGLGLAFNRSLPFAAISGFYLVARIAVLGGLGVKASPVTAATIVLTWPSLLWYYTKILVWPVGLSVFYDTPYVVRPGFSNFVLPLVAVVMSAGLLLLLARRSRGGRLAAVWLVAPVIPLLNIAVFRWADIVHDRYMYLPSVGFVILIALAVRRLHFPRSRLFGQPAVQVLTTVALMCLLGIALVSQHIHWASNLLLFHNSLMIAPNSQDARSKLGCALIDRGMYNEGLQLLFEVVGSEPDSGDANHEVGVALYRAGRYVDAEPYLARAIEITPSDSEPFYALGITLMMMARNAEAEAPLRQAVRLRPQEAAYHYALGSWYDMSGDSKSALDELAIVVENDPNYSGARDKILQIKARPDGAGPRRVPAPAGRSEGVGK